MYALLKYGFLILIILTSVNCVRKCYNSGVQKPIISALLELHSGSNCNIMNYHGLQQLAILESTIKQINIELNPIGIELVLQIFDTCSNKDGARVALLKALVASKQTCIKTPFFLGFLGPENSEAIDTVQQVSSLFRIPHIIPHSHEQHFRTNIYQVSKYPIHQHTKVLELFIKQLGLQRIIVLIEENELSTWKAENLIKELDGIYCLSQPIIIKKDHIIQAIDNFQQDFTAILAIIENPYIAEWIIEETNFFTNTTVLISVGKVGLISWPESLNNVYYVIQMISSSPIEDLNEAFDPFLLKELSHQINTKCDKNTSISDRIICDQTLGAQQDWTVNLLQYGLLLYSSNVRTAYYLKCQKEKSALIGLCPKLKYISRTEWNMLLSKASFFIKPPPSINKNKMIKFNMDVNVTFRIMIIEEALRQIGEYRNEKFIIEKNDVEEMNNFDHNNTMGCEPFLKKLIIQKEINHVEIHYFDDNSLYFDLRNLNYIQLIGLICGIGFGITIIFTLIFYNVYRTFNIITNRSSGCSTTSARGS